MTNQLQRCCGCVCANRPTGTTCLYIYTFKCWHESQKQMVEGRQMHVGRKDVGLTYNRHVLLDWHWYTSFLNGLDQADEGWGSCLRWCELFAQVRQRNSWNNNTNHCYTSGSKPLKDHKSAAALTGAQSTRRSWRYRACIMWAYIKCKRSTIKCDELDFSIRFAISTPVLHKYCGNH